MKRLILRIYDYFKRVPAVGISAALILVLLSLGLMLRLNYSEDISDFLPVDNHNQTALSVYQDVSGANKVVAILQLSDTTKQDPERLTQCVDAFTNRLEECDSAKYIAQIMSQVDMDMIMQVAENAYLNVPYFLTEKDYARADSLLATPDYVNRQLHQDKQLLMFPSSAFVGDNIGRDPLNLFIPVLSRLQKSSTSINYETYDNYIFSPDLKRAIVLITSPFGANETENNTKLVNLIRNVKGDVEQEYSDVEVHIFGGPSIAVGNSERIKTDSILAACIAGILILLLLIYFFRNAKNILLIIVSVGWGWIVAMGCISIIFDSISIIVMGIASVILGLAVNYPLHLISHLRDTATPRSALKEVVTPLIIGNVTTVGAFLTLTPLQSSALRNLGLFSSLLLLCTLIFVLLFLPHIIKKPELRHSTAVIDRLAAINPAQSKWLLAATVLLTIIFAYFSRFTEFDSDLRNINYMTKEQKADMDYFQSMLSPNMETQSLYVMSTGKNWDDVLDANLKAQPIIDSLQNAGTILDHTVISTYLSSQSQQTERLERWKRFLKEHHNALYTELPREAASVGFSSDAFDVFYGIINAEYSPKDISEFSDLTSTALSRNVSLHNSTGAPSVVEILEVPNDNIEAVKSAINGREENNYCFDLLGMNQAIAKNLSKDFNFIGYACSVIVFILLLLAFRNWECSIITFLPMVVSWLWILGIMAITGITFNIVNVILATFIFGQGADYAIFMMEGLSYEFAYKRSMLRSYKGTIIVSALIMFIAIGSLIISQHPAMRSLALVTIVGMISVVFISYIIPPVLFNWLVYKDGKRRKRPITIKKILCTGYCAVVFFSQLLTVYLLGFILFVCGKSTDRKKEIFHRYVTSLFRFDIKRMAGIHYSYTNLSGEDFSKPAIVVCNHQSLLDSMCLMVASPKILILANTHVATNPIIRPVFRWLGFFSTADDLITNLDLIKQMTDKGYSIALFPEGERNVADIDHIMRFHKGAFHLAQELSLDIVPIYLYGLKDVMPKGSALSNGGEIRIEIGDRISVDNEMYTLSTTDMAKAAHRLFASHYKEEADKMCTPDYYRQILLDRYRYKGNAVYRNAKKALRESNNFASLVKEYRNQQSAVIRDNAQGESAMMLALIYPNMQITVTVNNDEMVSLVEGCAEGFLSNLHVECI